VNLVQILTGRYHNIQPWEAWTINTQSGNNLKPEDGSKTVSVSVVVPNEENRTWTGQVIVENKDISSDKEYINVHLDTGGGQVIEPDLQCLGSLLWTSIQPGGTITGSFAIRNNGSADSKLNWKIAEWPDWGTWTFSISSGSNLKPDSPPVNIKVTVKAPEEYKKLYLGTVKIENLDNIFDPCLVGVTLITPHQRSTALFIERFLMKYPIFDNLISRILNHYI
jgi:hypothetical protein